MYVFIWMEVYFTHLIKLMTTPRFLAHLPNYNPWWSHQKLDLNPQSAPWPQVPALVHKTAEATPPKQEKTLATESQSTMTVGDTYKWSWYHRCHCPGPTGEACRCRRDSMSEIGLRCCICQGSGVAYPVCSLYHSRTGPAARSSSSPHNPIKHTALTNTC